MSSSGAGERGGDGGGDGSSSSSGGRRSVRAAPYKGESTSSRIQHAVNYKRVHVLVPYHQVAATWRVPPSTLQRHATKSVKRRGGQTVFSSAQEEVFARHLLRCADALWPISVEQLKSYVQRFLEVNPRIPAKRFRNRRPGKDWIAGFLRRWPVLKKRRAAAISSAKAWGTDAGKLRDFFQRLRPLLTAGDEFCAPDCVLNYDETAIGEDAGDPVVLTRRATKAPRAVLNNNRSNRSVMFAVTADGTCLPPYVCTKTKFKEEDLVAFSPPLCHWGTSKSGWFTMAVFDAWFESVVVPWALSKAPRKTLVLGDNLSAHLSPVSLQRAAELGVSFRLLPPNTTHFLQPLDVAFFGPLKGAWKSQLMDYKRSTTNKSVLKKDFAREFKRLVDGVKSEWITSGFKACGIVPFDPEAAVSRMPANRNQEPADCDGAVLVAALNLNQEQRVATNRQSKRPPAGTELANIPPAPASEPMEQPPPPPPAPTSTLRHNPESTADQQEQQPPPPPTPSPEVTVQQSTESYRRSCRRVRNRFPSLLLNRVDPSLYYQ